MSMDNQQRADLIEMILADHFDLEDLDPDSALGDLLANARHFADKYDLDYGECDRMGYIHYSEERWQERMLNFKCPHCGNNEDFEQFGQIEDRRWKCSRCLRVSKID